MQGRITKVLNMKPIEILSMIEEAAGTRMFEEKKQDAIKTIEKKQLKVDEITKCMNDEITPNLEGLRSGRQDYLNWQENNNELERLERVCIAFEYCEADKKIQNFEADRQKLIEQDESLNEVIQARKVASEECISKINEIRERDSAVEGKVHHLKQVESEVSKYLVKASTLLSNQIETIQSEKEVCDGLQKQLESTNSQLQSRANDLKICNVKLEEKEKEAVLCEEAYVSTRERYQNACAGVVDDTSSAQVLSIPEQVGSWEKKERESSSQAKQLNQRIEHAKTSLKEQQKVCKQQKTNHDTSINEANNLRSTIASTEKKLKEFKLKESDEIAIRTKVENLRSKRSQMLDKSDVLNANLEARLGFEFKDPEKGFDRSRVKGLVAKLIRVKDIKAATALEITAGAKLYQVVVDSEKTGKLLLQNGQLRKRVTILPLNKISNRCVDPEKLLRAQNIAASMGGTAQLALELVSFDNEVRRAIEHVFGSTIICNSADIAKQIAFDKSIRTKTVTLDGDVFDPSGTLTGGANGQLGFYYYYFIIIFF
jgi:structural maintenance of chromosome 2